MSSDSIDWEAIMRTSRKERTLGKIKMGPPLRAKLETPLEGGPPVSERPRGRPFKKILFSLQDRKKHDDTPTFGSRTQSLLGGNDTSIDQLHCPSFDLQESNKVTGYHDSSQTSRQREQSLSPAPPRLKTFDLESFLSSRNLTGQKSQGLRSSSCFESPVSVSSASVSRGPPSTQRSQTNHQSCREREHADTSRHRHFSYSPQRLSSRSISSPSLLKNEPRHECHPLSPLREQNTPIVTTSAPRNSHKNSVFINGKNYTIVDKIGSGGSSEVFRVLDENNKIKAIKKVDLSQVSEDDARLFRNEVELLMKFKEKRRIVQIYDFNEARTSDGQVVLYVVMEYGEKDLSRLLREHSADDSGLTDAKTKFYWEEMLEAVQMAHNEGIIHLDLKPANFLTVGGTIKLIDFGIASKVDRDKTHVTKDNQLGTLNFMSPESIQDQSTPGGLQGNKAIIKISYKSDVWSLGCILYNMVYGKLPFGQIRNPYQKICAIVDPEFKIEFPPTGLRNHDPLVIDVLRKCLVRDPAKRASISELLNHPYLKKTPSSSLLKPSSQNVTELLSAFSNLTPNSKRTLVSQLNLGK